MTAAAARQGKEPSRTGKNNREPDTDGEDSGIFRRPALQVRMLGGFSIEYEGTVLRDSGSRSYRTWHLLAYLLYHRRRMFSMDQLIRALDPGGDGALTPNAFRVLILRARRLLSELNGGENAAAPVLIVNRKGMYGWNPDVETRVDVEEFEENCRAMEREEDPAARIAYGEKALSLYGGEFLPKFHSEGWVLQDGAYYLQLLVDTALRLFPLMNEAGMAARAAALCRGVLDHVPWHEGLYRELMRSLVGAGQYAAASEAYEELRGYLQEELGVVPEEETQAVYREAQNRVRDRALSLEEIRSRLNGADTAPGALLCDIQTFKMYYRAEARSVLRRGDSIHIAILTLAGKGGKALTERSARYAMGKLRGVLAASLRTGDIAAQCSYCQYIVMLIQANYENSNRVCDRIAQGFARACPRSSALIQAVVMPLEPAELDGGPKVFDDG